VKRKIEIVPYDEHEKVTFYSIRFDNESTEFDKFLDDFDTESHADQMDVFNREYDILGEQGAQERLLRYAGTKEDSLFSFPSHWVDCDLRVFLLKVSDDIVIFGNGFLKTTRTYNEDTVAMGHVSLLLSIDKILRKRLETLKVNNYQMQLVGDLTFYI